MGKKASAPAFDILEHSLVPKHELLSESEAEELLKRLNITKQQLPYILVSDPVVKRLGAKVGDIIRITRHSETAGTAVYYRVVWRET
ncbi:hypothetical protein HRbin01_01646 [archaeon HR01]|nr:hypothetical protein HRbin01_01646 [archaeon HR01]